MLDNMISWSIVRPEGSDYSGYIAQTGWDFALAVFKDGIAVILQSGGKSVSPIDGRRYDSPGLHGSIWTADFDSGKAVSCLGEVHNPSCIKGDIITEEQLRKACVVIKQYFDSNRADFDTALEKRKSRHASRTIAYFAGTPYML